MSRKTFTRKLALLLATALIVTASLAAATITANAAEKPLPMPKKVKAFFYAGNKNLNSLNVDPNFQVKSMKSSNKKIAVPKKSGKLLRYFQIKKAGKVTLTVKAKPRGKKKAKYKTYKTSAQFVSYTNPFKTYKVGDADFASQYKKAPFCELNNVQPLDGQLELQINGGWTLKGIRVYDSTTETEKKLKNGDVLNLEKGTIIIILKHQKSGIVQEFDTLVNLG